MAQVVQQRRGKRFSPRRVVEPLVRGELVTAGVDSAKKRLHDVGRANRVRKARVLRAREDERGEPELPHSTKPLDFARVEQRSNDALRHAFEGD